MYVTVRQSLIITRIRKCGPGPLETAQHKSGGGGVGEETCPRARRRGAAGRRILSSGLYDHEEVVHLLFARH